MDPRIWICTKNSWIRNTAVNSTKMLKITVFQIRDVLIQIQIRGYVALDYGSGSFSFLQWLSRSKNLCILWIRIRNTGNYSTMYCICHNIGRGGAPWAAGEGGGKRGGVAERPPAVLPGGHTLHHPSGLPLHQRLQLWPPGVCHQISGNTANLFLAFISS